MLDDASIKAERLKVASPTVSGRCIDVQNSTTNYVSVGNTKVEVVTETCSLEKPVALDVLSPVDVSWRTFRNGEDLPPIGEDCDKIKAAVQILSGRGSVRNTFTLDPGASKALWTTFSERLYGTCVYFFSNTVEHPLRSSWEDINIDASLARSDCYPPTMPMNSAGNCTALDKTWVVGTYHRAVYDGPSGKFILRTSLPKRTLLQRANSCGEAPTQLRKLDPRFVILKQKCNRAKGIL
ncbi:uncharacterized protein EV420DRAFT_1647627 [Desarmillaria tabescens]|uniref:Uncharacterized protein n=1 Tax=Armillaria tabescens TaxID=1929756 RepID=A0AA39MUT8_ARMTA|nr:uncharacterized protein EV420DRAFT_1647627 [Desarmillaria tabescens]KAK0447886.1 hypothetical protein EV420DRAFT_1647627 [Desarmillaria tabescens]